MTDPARSPLPRGGEYPTYFHLLADLHRRLRPARYLEIGVNEGHSLALSLPTTRLVGVDPEPRVGNLDHPDWTVVPTTSKDFFAYHDVMGLLGGLVDLAFVDGLHHFEVALADVLAIERYAHPGTVVLVHDVVPIDAPTSTRDRATLVCQVAGAVRVVAQVEPGARPTFTIRRRSKQAVNRARCPVRSYGNRKLPALLRCWQESDKIQGKAFDECWCRCCWRGSN